MVVGNGMIAKAFSAYINQDNIVIYASGVSNSKEESDKNFEREFSLLKECVEKNKRSLIVYFSTCSVNDKSLSKTKYVQHKIIIEDYIKSNVSNFIIFRLPIVIGNTENKFTLFNFLKERLTANEDLVIQKNAYRYLVDMDDASSVLSQIVDSKEFTNSIIEVAFSESISVLDMAYIMKNTMRSNSKITLVEGGDSYFIDNSLIKKFISDKKISIQQEYNERLLKKYLKEKITI